MCKQVEKKKSGGIYGATAKENHRENNTCPTTRRDVVRHTVRRRAKANCHTAVVSAAVCHST